MCSWQILEIKKKKAVVPTQMSMQEKKNNNKEMLVSLWNKKMIFFEIHDITSVQKLI